MSRRLIRGSRGIVTGASSGIGREIARELARQGARLLLTARRADRLAELCDEIKSLGGEAAFVAGDVTDAQLRTQLLDWVRERWGELDLLVNNAGIGAMGPFAEADEQRLRHIMEVNFFAPAELMRQALPFLQQGSRPLIVNVSSVLAHRAVPRKSEYCASKFALHGLSDALRAELKQQGVELLLVSPSTTQSEFFDQMPSAQGKGTKQGTAGMPAAIVAQKTVRAIQRGSHEIILTPGGKLLVWLDRLCPTWADYLVARFSR